LISIGWNLTEHLKSRDSDQTNLHKTTLKMEILQN